MICAAVLAVISIGCAAKHRPLLNYQPGVQARVFIKPSECRDISGGKYECNHVIFDPQTVAATTK